MRTPVTNNAVEGSTGVQQAGRDILGIPVQQHVQLLREAKDELRIDLEAKFAESKRADAAERKNLELQISVLKTEILEYDLRLAEPEVAYKEFQKTNARLEALLDRSGNEIGGDRLQEALQALRQGDYSMADNLFAETEVQREMEVKESARASFGRGEIAEAEVRWHDAAIHYSRAAQLAPDFESLFKAGDFTWRCGDYTKSLYFSQEFIYLARSAGDRESLAKALNQHAINWFSTRQYSKAEPLFREALKISHEINGPQHLIYSRRLNNLGRLLDEIGRHEEAEPLYRDALKITCKTLGKKHQSYALRLKNLSALLRKIGQYEEAELLARKALSIRLEVLGKDHPDYAHSLNSLAGLLDQTGRSEEAAPLYREALEIFEKTLGTDHTNTQKVRENFESFRNETDR